MEQTAQDRRDERDGMEAHNDLQDALEKAKEANHLEDEEHHPHIEADHDIKTGTDEKGVPNILREIDKFHLLERIGQLYTELNQDHIPELADHIEDMHGVKDDVKRLIEAVHNCVIAFDKTAEDLKRQKDSNTKLMYEQLRRSEDDFAKHDPNSELDEKLKHVDVDD